MLHVGKIYDFFFLLLFLHPPVKVQYQINQSAHGARAGAALPGCQLQGGGKVPLFDIPDTVLYGRPHLLCQLSLYG